ncbi:MAG: TonB-dependent receptor [Nevskia sp.]|nr:TonB-dependent receptor [Nevskia sp.]
MKRKFAIAAIALGISLGLVSTCAFGQSSSSGGGAQSGGSGGSDLEKLLSGAGVSTEPESSTSSSSSGAASASSSSGAQAQSPAAGTSPTAAQPAAPASPIGLPTTAAAPPAPQTERANSNRLEEIVVTAERREERLQDVPISISVFTQKQLANANISNPSDLALYTPSLSVNPRFGSDNASFSIRGFTQDLRTTASVGVYFAEVVAPRGQSSQTSGDGAAPGELFDLQNIQVLKGPQGTLFGRNTTGGAVLLVPNKPGDELEGYYEQSVSDYDGFREQGVINFPVTPNFKLRLAIDKNQRDGYLTNVLNIGASRFGDLNVLSARASALWNITPSVDNYTIYSFSDSDNTGSTARLFACNTAPTELFTIAINVLVGPGCRAQLAAQVANGQNGFYDLESSIRTPITAIHERRVINTTTWRIDDALTLKDIFGFAHLLTQNGSSIFGTHFHESLDANPNREWSAGASLVSPYEPVTNQNTFVEELQLQGRSFADKLQWQTGAYFEHSLPNGYSGNISADVISCQLSTIEDPNPAHFNCFDPSFGLLGSVLYQQYKQDYLNRAVYSQATYNFTDQLSAILGLRYTWDKASGYGIKTRYTFALITELAPRIQISTPNVESQAPTGQLELSYKPIEGAMVYGKYVRGYRQGSIVLAADPGLDTFKPEHINSYEFGGKGEFGGPVPGQLNFAIFYNALANQQLQLGYISTGAGTTTTIVNAGRSDVAGAEADGVFQLTDSLRLTLSWSRLITKLAEEQNETARVAQYAGFLGGLSVTPIAIPGETLPFAPNHAEVATLSYRLPISEDFGPVDVAATYSYVGTIRAGASTQTPYAELPGHPLLNLNLNWTSVFNKPIDVSLFATNVLNREYTTYVSATYSTLGYDSRIVGAPQMFGTRLRYNFGAYAH